MQNWKYIPKNAFLYFPQNQEIKVGTKQKAWRKIFQGNVPYDDFEIENLEKLQAAIQTKKILVDKWFDKPNKLRYLQANKFDIKKTCDSINQYSKWRQTKFPINLTEKHYKLLNSGAVQIIGRDNCFRPIIFLNTLKFDVNDGDIVPQVLVQVMEFVISQLFIEGQVENYILIMDLQGASLGMRGLISNILSFTSNSYRSRLYRCYLLLAPTFLVWGWNGIISKFVSESTLHKIRLSSQTTQNEMWTHMHKDIVFKKYGGNRTQSTTFTWPPKIQDMVFEPAPHPKLISQQKYYQLYKSTKIKNRKISEQLIMEQQRKQKKILQAKAQNQTNNKLSNFQMDPVYSQDLRNLTPKILKTFFKKQSYNKIRTKK